MNPVQPASRSYAAASRAPSSSAISALEVGNIMSRVTVAQTRQSISRGSSCACASAARAASGDGCEERQPAALLLLGQHSDRARLRERLDDQKAGHDWAPREVTGQIPLVVAHVLACGRTDTRRQFDDLVDEEERLAVRQDLFDLRAAQRQRNSQAA